MDATSNGKPLIFENFVIDPREHQLLVGGEPVKIGIRAFHLLMVLVERNGHLVSKDELLELVWPKMVVEENTLQVHISALRKLLGPDVIVTVSGLGYRFTANAHEQVPAPHDSPLPMQVSPVAGASTESSSSSTRGFDSPTTGATASAPAVSPSAGPAPRGGAARKPLMLAALGTLAAAMAIGAWFLGEYTGARSSQSPLVSAQPETSIAVLPFIDLSAKKDQEYFSDGLSEELISRLAQSADLKVIARTSAFSFKGQHEDIRTIASKLGVTTLLEGSVRTSGKLLRITAQLIRANDGVSLWSHTYDRNVLDILTVQDEIAGAVAASLKAALNSARTLQPQATNPEAYILLLQGNFFFNRNSKEDSIRALEFYRKAIDLDPKYAHAWRGLASTYLNQANSGWASAGDAGKAARSAAENALRLDPNDSEVYAVLGKISQDIDWDWESARKYFLRAHELDPNSIASNDGLAYLNGGIYGQFGDWIRVTRQSLSRDPLNTFVHGDLNHVLFISGRYEEAAGIAQDVLVLNPSFAPAHVDLALPLLYLGRVDEALTAAKSETDPAWRLATLPIIFWTLGKKTESDAALKEMEEKYADIGAYNIAEIRAYRSEIDVAFQWLDRAYRQRDAAMTDLRIDPLLQNIRKDPRYHELLVRMKLDGDPPPSLH